MKNWIFSAFTLIAVSVVLFSCGEDTVEPSDKELPIITKIYPAITHQAYDFGDTAFFKLTFSDNESLKDVSLKLYLETDEVMLFTQKFPNAKTSSIDTFIIMNDPRFSDLDFDIKAIDASGNVALMSSHIHLR
jgi:hypothetical protein